MNSKLIDQCRTNERERIKTVRLENVADIIYQLLVKKECISRNAISKSMGLHSRTFYQYCEEDKRLKQIVARYRKMTMRKCSRNLKRKPA